MTQEEKITRELEKYPLSENEKFALAFACFLNPNVVLQSLARDAMPLFKNKYEKEKKKLSSIVE